MKKKINYYDVYILMADYVKKSIQIIDDTINNFSMDTLIKNEEIIHDYESKSDEAVHSIINQLVMDFITPMDREDLSLVAYRLDDVVDNVDDILTNIKIYNIDKVNDEIKELSKSLMKVSSLLENMINYFGDNSNSDKVFKLAKEIADIEENTDILYQENVSKLFKSNNAIEILKWSYIYDTLEKTFDSFAILANAIENATLKNI